MSECVETRRSSNHQQVYDRFNREIAFRDKTKKVALGVLAGIDFAACAYVILGATAGFIAWTTAIATIPALLLGGYIVWKITRPVDAQKRAEAVQARVERYEEAQQYAQQERFWNTVIGQRLADMYEKIN